MTQTNKPHHLAPLPPKLNWKSPVFADMLLKARVELAELKGYSASVPNPMLLISPAVIKESVASSSVENINTTVLGVLQNQMFPTDEQHGPDKEVLRYRDAVLWGYKNLRSMGFSKKLISGIADQLVPDLKGQFRKIQNQIQNTTSGEVLYTPPSPVDVPKLILNWEEFIRLSDNRMDPLLACAVAHYQFEAIHPFEDGNGRAGRILMVLQLVHAGVLGIPILYISGYITKNRTHYYRLLKGVTRNGNWEEFILFLLKGFYLQAKHTKATLIAIADLHEKLREQIRKDHHKIYSADLVEALFTFPIITPVRLGKALGVHYTTASRHLAELAKAGIVRGAQVGRYHMYVNDKLLTVVRK